MRTAIERARLLLLLTVASSFLPRVGGCAASGGGDEAPRPPPTQQPDVPTIPPIISAARAGDLATVSQILSSDPAAVASKQPPTMKMEMSNEGRTALHWAAERGDAKLARLLISHGADVAARDDAREQPLHMTENEQVAAALLAAGADPMARDSGDRTPLYHARSADVAETLLKAGADVNDARARTRETPLHAAAASGRADVVKLLLRKGARVDVTDEYGNTPLYVGARSGPRVVRLLLDHGADPNARPGGDDDRPLDEALMAGHGDTTRLLIERGADPRRCDEFGFNALHLAAIGGSADAAELLLSLGLDVNSRTRDGVTPLMTAAKYGHLEFVRLLLDSGADPHVRSKDGRTALLEATKEEAYPTPAGTSQMLRGHRAWWEKQQARRRATADLLRERGARD